jgi:hypothetical protein
MIVAVQGSNNFDDYTVFLRSMAVALSGMADSDKELHVYSVGPTKVNNFVSEFCNLTEKGFRGRGKKVKYYKAQQDWVADNIQTIHYFAYLCNENEHPSKLVATAQLNNVEIGIFRY